MNASIEPVLDEQREGTAAVVDLYARDGARPRGFEAALQRKNGLLFGNQTARLDIYRKHWEQGGQAAPSVLCLSYRPTGGGRAGSRVRLLAYLSGEPLARRQLDAFEHWNGWVSPRLQWIIPVRRASSAAA